MAKRNSIIVPTCTAGARKPSHSFAKFSFWTNWGLNYLIKDGLLSSRVRESGICWLFDILMTGNKQVRVVSLPLSYIADNIKR
jgi:hypothetical protein